MDKLVVPLLAILFGVVGMLGKIAMWYDEGNRKFDLTFKKILSQLIITIVAVIFILLHGYYQEGWGKYVIYEICLGAGILGSKAVSALLKLLNNKINLGD